MRRGILASTDDLAALRKKIDRKPFNAIYNALRARCSLILQSAPVTETNWRTLWQQGRHGAALYAARTTQGRILDLLIAHHIDHNAAYRARAVEEVMNLVGWSTWVDPCHSSLPADPCTAEAAVAAVVALDWLWDELSEADRLRVLQAVSTKAIEPYRRGLEQQAVWANCYHSWNAVINSGCGLAALALGDEDPSAQEAYKQAGETLQPFFDALGREGGWDEGTGYWGYAMRYVLLFGEAASRLVDDQRIFHARGMDATGLFGVYFTPNGHAASFGDLPAVPVYGALYLLVKRYGLREVLWWLDTYSFHHDVQTSGWSTAGLAMLFRPAEKETPRRPKLSEVKVFGEIGWAAIADHWPQPEMYVAAKTGDLSANHSQRDMNSIQLQIDGEMLLTDFGNTSHGVEYPAEPQGESYEIQACAHNTIIVAERDHQIDAQGRIVEDKCEKCFRWVACDAGNACGEGVRFVRHLVMAVNAKTQNGEMLFVLDELYNGVPERVEWFWHTQGKIEFDPEELSGTITGAQAGVHFAIVAGAGMTARAWTESHQPGANRTDHLVRISAGVVGSRLLLSVFSREPLAEKPTVKETNGGDVTITAGKWTAVFKAHKQYLQLRGLSDG